jgi:hypothetical protein
MDGADRSMPSRFLVFSNVGQVPFNNNLLPPVRAFERRGEVRLVEPFRLDGFQSTGGARPAQVPDDEVRRIASEFAAELVLCVGGAIFITQAARACFPPETIFVGIALSDPLGLEASMAIAPEFDLFYTQDPQTIPAYAENGISARRCDLAIDRRLYYPETSEIECDVVFVGKWTAYRDALIRELARCSDVRVYGHAAESRWGLPVHPPLDSPDELRRAMCRSRLALDFALVEQPGKLYDGSFRMTPRAQIAAACGVACLIEGFAGLEEFFSPGSEIETFSDADDLVMTVMALLDDIERRKGIAEAAHRRVLAEQTWDHRASQILDDVRELRNGR